MLSETLDLDALGTTITEWLEPRVAARWPGSSLVRIDPITAPEGVGFSNETLFLTLHRTAGDGDAATSGEVSERCVLRMRPEIPIFPEYDLRLQYRCMELLGPTDVAVPQMLWFEGDPSVAGSAFFVAGRVDGRVPGDNPPYHTPGWVADLSADDQRALWDNGLAALAAVHRIDWKAYDFGFLPAADPGGVSRTASELGRYEQFLDWAAKGRDYPVQRAALQWLRANEPPGGRVGLCWGDSRLANLMYGDDLCPTAVLDWEMACIGDPEMDLAWWIFLDWHQSAGFDFPRLGGLPDREATVKTYEGLTGATVGHLDYWETYAAFRFAVIWIRLDELVKKAGLMPDEAGDLGAANPCVDWLSDRL